MNTTLVKKVKNELIKWNILNREIKYDPENQMDMIFETRITRIELYFINKKDPVILSWDKFQDIYWWHKNEKWIWCDINKKPLMQSISVKWWLEYYSINQLMRYEIKSETSKQIIYKKPKKLTKEDKQRRKWIIKESIFKKVYWKDEDIEQRRKIARKRKENEKIMKRVKIMMNK